MNYEEQILEILRDYGYNPIVSESDVEGYRELFESEGWYPGCRILVSNNEYSGKLTRMWFEED